MTTREKVLAAFRDLCRYNERPKNLIGAPAKGPFFCDVEVKDAAKLAGVSRGTVLRIAKDLMNEGVLDGVHYGYAWRFAPVEKGES